MTESVEILIKIIKGNILYTKTGDRFEVHEQSHVVIEGKHVKGIYKELPKTYAQETITDYGEAIIIPSFIDLHIHGPQFMQRGIGMNLELIDWLNQYTFMLEGRFADVNYAAKVYPNFVDSLYDHGSLRSVIFGTVHDESNRYLVEALKKKGLSAYVGKVNMNRNDPVSLTETTARSLRETEDFIKDYGGDDFVRPVITPRFAPSCTEDLLKGLGDLSVKYHVPVQSHLSENRDEVAWVRDLFPASSCYSDVYRKNNLMGQEKTLMAHGIYLEEGDIELAMNDNVFLVHCPFSNLNLASGIMPLTRYLDMGLQVGLGSDVGGGYVMAMEQTIAQTIQWSQMLYVNDNSQRILGEVEAFWLCTKVNGRYFGEDVGSLEEGYRFDALVIKDKDPLMVSLTPLEQLQRFLYCGEPGDIIARYMEGEAI